MIDGSYKCKRQLAFELQNLHVYEKRSKLRICMYFTRNNFFTYLSPFSLTVHVSEYDFVCLFILHICFLLL